MHLIPSDEYTAFQALIEHLKMAAACAKVVGSHQPDKKIGWDMVGQSLDVVALSCFKLSQERAEAQSTKIFKPS